MAHEPSLENYKNWYKRLLRFYPEPFRARFGEQMVQTLADLLREQTKGGHGLFGRAVWIFAETAASVVRQNVMSAVRGNNKRVARVFLATAFMLSLPLVAMQFTDDVVWNGADFVVAGALLLSFGLTYERITRQTGGMAYRLAIGIALTTGFVLVWANLAVGVIGNESHPLNLLYGGVLAVGIIGALVSRLHPRGMARTLFATAIAQASVAIVALIAGAHRDSGSSISEILGVNAVFAALFVGSALLFRRAHDRFGRADLVAQR